MTAGGVVGRRRAHIEDLCEQHRITIEYAQAAGSHGGADPGRRRVLIPQTTRVRSYYVALHEIGHCVLGYDKRKLAAPQEAVAWKWAIENAVEPPSPGVRRMMFRALWHYLLSDLAGERQESLMASERVFPMPEDRFWVFLASLDDSSRLLYEAAKVTSNVGPVADAREAVRETIERQRDRQREAARRARVERELKTYSPPRPARVGERVLIGASSKAHVWAGGGMYGTMLQPGDIVCGAVGVGHLAPEASPICRACERIVSGRLSVRVESDAAPAGMNR